MIYRDELYWAKSSNFYKCVGPEPWYTDISFKQSNTTSTSSSESYYYKIGDIVRCREWAKDSGWDGIVYDKRDGRYQIEITNIVSGSWFKSGLQATECSGNKYLNYDSVTYGPTYIWIPKSCVE